MSVSVEDMLTPIGLDSAPVDIPTGNVIICATCGNPFERTGRGRPPKYCGDCRGQRGSGNSAPRSASATGDQKQAEAVLDGMYQMTTLGLMMFNPSAAAVWEDGLPKLRASNSVSLAGDKKLCASIAKMGRVSSKGMFISAHVMAVLPVAAVIREDLAIRRAESNSYEETETPNNVTQLPQPRTANPGFFG